MFKNFFKILSCITVLGGCMANGAANPQQMFLPTEESVKIFATQVGEGTANVDSINQIVIPVSLQEKANLAYSLDLLRQNLTYSSDAAQGLCINKLLELTSSIREDITLTSNLNQQTIVPSIASHECKLGALLWLHITTVNGSQLKPEVNYLPIERVINLLTAVKNGSRNYAQNILNLIVYKTLNGTMFQDYIPSEWHTHYNGR